MNNIRFTITKEMTGEAVSYNSFARAAAAIKDKPFVFRHEVAEEVKSMFGWKTKEVRVIR